MLLSNPMRHNQLIYQFCVYLYIAIQNFNNTNYKIKISYTKHNDF